MRKRQKIIILLLGAALYLALLPCAAAHAEGDGAVFGIAILRQQQEIDLSWSGNYTFVQVKGSYQESKPALVAAAPEGTDTLRVMEAWRVQDLQGTELRMTVRLDTIPTLNEEESLALYPLVDGTLGESPLLRDLSVGDLATIQLNAEETDGIALVRVMSAIPLKVIPLRDGQPEPVSPTGVSVRVTQYLLLLIAGGMLILVGRYGKRCKKTED